MNVAALCTLLLILSTQTIDSKSIRGSGSDLFEGFKRYFSSRKSATSASATTTSPYLFPGLVEKLNSSVVALYGSAAKAFSHSGNKNSSGNGVPRLHRWFQRVRQQHRNRIRIRNRSNATEHLTNDNDDNKDESVSDDVACYGRNIDDLKALALEYMSLDTLENWDFLGKEDDIMVWKLKRPLRSNAQDDQWPCIRSITTIDLPVSDLIKIVLDSTKVTQYNKYSGGRDDIILLGPNSKIVWNRTKIPFAIKPYDFCTLMVQGKSFESTLIMSKAVECSKVPIHPDYSRSEVIFGLNILTPSKFDNSKTDFTTISHVRYAGTHPFLAWRSALQGSITYFKSLKSVIKSIHG